MFNTIKILYFQYALFERIKSPALILSYFIISMPYVFFPHLFQDKGLIRTFPVPLILIGGKYDLFEVSNALFDIETLLGAQK
jgi:hypothetical protein